MRTRADTCSRRAARTRSASILDAGWWSLDGGVWMVGPEKVTVLRKRQEGTGGCAQGTGNRPQATGPGESEQCRVQPSEVGAARKYHCWIIWLLPMSRFDRPSLSEALVHRFFFYVLLHRALFVGL